MQVSVMGGARHYHNAAGRPFALRIVIGDEQFVLIMQSCMLFMVLAGCTHSSQQSHVLRIWC